MDINVITQLIGSLGFPIVVSIVLFFHMEKAEEKNKEMLERQNEVHRDEMNKITEALNNNTVALTELATLLKEK